MTHFADSDIHDASLHGSNLDGEINDEIVKAIPADAALENLNLIASNGGISNDAEIKHITNCR